MSILNPDPDSKTPDAIRDAAHNAVAAAALAYHAEADRLRYVFQLARQHGLTDDEIIRASGMPAWFVTRLLAEIA